MKQINISRNQIRATAAMVLIAIILSLLCGATAMAEEYHDVAADRTADSTVGTGDIFEKAGIKDCYSKHEAQRGEYDGTMQLVRTNKYNGINCMEVLPLEMKENLPMLVFLPGTGGYEHLGSETFMRYAMNGRAGNDFILLAINTNSFNGATSEAQLQVIEEVAEKYRVDKSRIVISGASAGAGHAAALISEYPGYFALGILISGCLTGLDKNTKTPLLLVAGNGGEWGLALPKAQEAWAEEINSLGGNARFTLFDRARHVDTPSILAIPDVWTLILSV